MSVTFYGMTDDRRHIALDIEDPAHLNLANENARCFLFFLGIEPGDDLTGEVGMPEARRAIMRAKATFDRMVGGFTREANDTKRPGKARLISGGIDARYFERRLDDFERFLNVIAANGARAICWA